MLFYFGETYNNDNCGCCDNCLHPKQKMEGKEYVQVLLSTVKELKQQFKEKHIINVIVGNASSDVKKFKHNQLKCFGEGQDKDDKFWASLIRQMLFEKILVKDIENYGILKITPAGEKFLKHPFSIKITKIEEDERRRRSKILAMCPYSKGRVIDKVYLICLKIYQKHC